ncbi:D-xylose-proton symporter [invertebrate metagenome]|uniref:D-xylose-proton symporter n=1 Tax=invertebrate metagenome TaxID=1711999 RepID=A0A2H9T4Z4_9ZZZZ
MKKDEHDLVYIFRICLITALGGLLFGYDTAVISGAIGPLEEYFSLTPAMTGWAVSNVVLGCIVGSYMAGKISLMIGRKKSLQLSALLFFISALGSALAPDFTFFVVLRMVGGLAVGMASVLSPMYMSEVTPTQYRGRAVSLHQQSVVIGQLIVFYVNFLIARGMTDSWLVNLGWRYMLGSEMIPGLLLGFLIFFIPESPRWCVVKGKDEEAMRILTRISNPGHAKHLFKAIKSSLQEHHQDKPANLRTKGLFSIVVIGCLIASIQQFTGINVIMYYSPEILKPVAGGTELALFQTTLIGIVFVFGNALGMFLIDKVGRLPLLKVGTVGAILGILLTSWGIYDPDAGKYAAMLGVMLYIISYAVSWGCCCLTVVSEIFPNRIRSRAMGLAFTCQWICGFIVTQSFPMLNGNPWLHAHFHGAFSFWLFAACCVIALWFIHRYIPETKGISLEKMEAHLMARYGDKKAESELVYNH